MDWENLIVTLLMTSFFVIKNQLQHFTKLTALEIKLEIMVVDVCSKVGNWTVFGKQSKKLNISS